MKKRYLAILFVPLCLFANPEGGKVTSGAADITSEGNTLNINCGKQTIINWDSFSIKAGELTRITMPSSSSTILNRVVGGKMSEILGRLESNGRVFLLNPYGVLIGKDACINVSSFLASTFELLDNDFLNSQEFLFKDAGSGEALINLGTIKAFDGDVALLGRIVKNEGRIEARSGSALLGAGKEILLKPNSSDKIYIKPHITDKKAEVGIENKGDIDALSSELKADGNLYSLAIKNTGKINAISMKQEGGEIFLVADGGTVVSSGKITAKKEENGGKVTILGERVGLLDEATIDVSGKSGGGTVLIGGDRIDNQPNFIAKEVFTSEKSKIMADAIENGDGGKIVFLGKESAVFKGLASAKGGEKGGDGGLVEISSNGVLSPGTNIYTNAPHGKIGILLLDPTQDITITTNPTQDVVIDPPPPPPPNVEVIIDPLPSATAPNIQNTGVANNTLQTLLTNNDVLIETSGSVFFQAPVTWTSSNTLTVFALTNIEVQPASVTGITNTSGGSLVFTAGNNILVEAPISISRDITFGPAFENSTLTILVSGNGYVRSTGIGTTASPRNISITCGSGGLAVLPGTGSGGFIMTNTNANSPLGNIEIVGQTSSTIYTIDVESGSALHSAFIDSENGNVTINTAGTLFVGNTAQNQLGSCFIQAKSSGVNGNVSCTCGAIHISGGNSGTATSYILSRHTLTINETGPSGSGDVTLVGGTVTGADAYLISETGPIVSNIKGDYILTAKSGAAYITDSSGNINLTGQNFTLHPFQPTSTGFTEIFTSAGGNILINPNATAPTGTMTLTAGANYSYIDTQSNGSITINIQNLQLQGGVGEASIFTDSPATGGNININANSTLTSGSLTLLGGSGGGDADIMAVNLGTINAFAPNNYTLTAGSGAATGNVYIQTTNGDINLKGTNFTLTGNTGFAEIDTTDNGNIFINQNVLFPTGTLLLQAGTGALASIYTADGGDISININALSLLAGSGLNPVASITTENGGDIFINQNAHVSGDVNIIAGSSDTANAFIKANNGSIIMQGGNFNILGSAIALGFAEISTDSVSSGNITLSGTNFYLEARKGQWAQVRAYNEGDISVTATQEISLVGGDNLGIGIFHNYTTIDTQNGDITVNANSLLLQGGDSSVDGYASIETLKGDINVNLGSGDSFLNAGIGHPGLSYALIYTDQGNINITNSGTVTLNGSSSPGFNNYALIQAAGISPSNGIINITGGNYMLNGGSGDGCFAAIEGENGLNINTSGIIVLQGNSSATGSYAALSSSSGNVIINAGNISLFGGASSSYASILSPNDLAHVYADNSILLNATGAGLAQIFGNVVDFSAIEGSVTLQGSNASIISKTSLTGSAGDNIYLNNGLIEADNGGLLLTAGDEVTLSGSSLITMLNGASTDILLIKAGNDLEIGSGSEIRNNTGTDTTLVVDNDFPIPPEIGDGRFILRQGGKVTSKGPLRIFTAMQEFNIIEDNINGVPFTPGTPLTDSNHERWGVYYPNSFFGGPGYTLFYKNNFNGPQLITASIGYALSELFYRLNDHFIDFIIIDPCQRYIRQSKGFHIRNRCLNNCRNLNMRVATF